MLCLNWSKFYHISGSFHIGTCFFVSEQATHLFSVGMCHSDRQRESRAVCMV